MEGYVFATLKFKTGKSWGIELGNGDTVVIGQRCLELITEQPSHAAPLSERNNIEEDVISMDSSASNSDADEAIDEAGEQGTEWQYITQWQGPALHSSAQDLGSPGRLAAPARQASELEAFGNFFPIN